MTDRLQQLRAQMTPKQIAFCEAYASNGGNGVQAAKSAGYAEPRHADFENITSLQPGDIPAGYAVVASAAYETLKNPQVISYLGELAKSTRQHRIMSAQERMAWLTRVIEGTEQSEGKDGKSRPAPMLVRVQATNELNRMTGAHAAVKLDVTLQVRTSAQEWLQAVLEAIQSRLALSDSEIESLLPHIPSMRLQGKELPIIDVERG